MRYTQLTDQHVERMLATIGVDSIDALLEPIPEPLQLNRSLAIPPGVSELELLRDTGELAARNRTCEEQVCFLGGGAYDHFIPTVVDAMVAQSEFLTAYTPYQAEASQGILQLFYEFQTMVCQLTGMEIANASLYEVSSATAEAAFMATTITRRKRIVVAGSVHPDTSRVLATYARQRDVEVITVATPDGVVRSEALAEAVDDATAAVILQSPNFFGAIERIDQLIPLAHSAGALAIIIADPISCGMLTRPGDLDADLVVGEGQGLGIPLQYGGPYLGLLAGREKYLRKMPGRVVGLARDGDGRRGFCLALQTREQHIKRERATSNVCTNQGLLAIRAAVYMATVGREGIAKVAKQCFDKAHYAAGEISKLDGYELRFDAPFFKEFVVRTNRKVDRVLRACRERNILGGIALARFHETLDDCFLVAVTEKRTKGQIDTWVAALADA